MELVLLEESYRRPWHPADDLCILLRDAAIPSTLYRDVCGFENRAVIPESLMLQSHIQTACRKFVLKVYQNTKFA